jgi:hypothetical protein
MNVQHHRLNSYYAKILTRLNYFAKMIIYRCSLYPRVLIARASDAGALVTVSIGVIGLGISKVKSAGTIGLLPR